MKSMILECNPYEGLKNGTHLDVEVFYDKGGHNLLSGYYCKRGFYLSVVPVTCGKNSKTQVLFAGNKKLLMEVNRYTEKQFQRAIAMAKAQAPELIAFVLAKERAAW